MSVLSVPYAAAMNAVAYWKPVAMKKPVMIIFKKPVAETAMVQCAGIPVVTIGIVNTVSAMAVSAMNVFEKPLIIMSC